VGLGIATRTKGEIEVAHVSFSGARHPVSTGLAEGITTLPACACAPLSSGCPARFFPALRVKTVALQVAVQPTRDAIKKRKARQPCAVANRMSRFGTDPGKMALLGLVITPDWISQSRTLHFDNHA
jgi:hypothetical protein